LPLLDIPAADASRMIPVRIPDQRMMLRLVMTLNQYRSLHVRVTFRLGKHIL
jgi:hypothetical protein